MLVKISLEQRVVGELRCKQQDQIVDPEDRAHPGLRSKAFWDSPHGVDDPRRRQASNGGVADDACWPLDMRQEASPMVRFPRNHPS